MYSAGASNRNGFVSIHGLRNQVANCSSVGVISGFGGGRAASRSRCTLLARRRACVRSQYEGRNASFGAGAESTVSTEYEATGLMLLSTERMTCGSDCGVSRLRDETSASPGSSWIGG